MSRTETFALAGWTVCSTKGPIANATESEQYSAAIQYNPY